MLGLTAQRQLQYVPPAPARTRAWRPFPHDVADLVCVDEAAAVVSPRIHGRPSMVVVPANAVIRIESSRSIVAEQDWVVFVPAWQLYGMRRRAAAQVSERLGISLLFGGRDVQRLAALGRAAVVTDRDAGAQLTALVSQLRRPVRSLDCAAVLPVLLERLLASSTPVAMAREGQAVELLVAIRDHLRRHLAEPVPTSELARLTGLTESHLIRAFHGEFGLPPHAYHVRLRLAAASDLLAQGVSVSAAAYESGFADQSHLSRKFKEVYGLTPAAWAKAVADPPEWEAPS